MELQRESTSFDENQGESEKTKASSNSLIKSTASPMIVQNRFVTLSKDTDLNEVTKDWFWKSSILNYFNRWTHKKLADPLASFKMANKYVDDGFIGEFDVISDAEVNALAKANQSDRSFRFLLF